MCLTLYKCFSPCISVSHLDQGYVVVLSLLASTAHASFLLFVFCICVFATVIIEINVSINCPRPLLPLVFVFVFAISLHLEWTLSQSILKTSECDWLNSWMRVGLVTSYPFIGTIYAQCKCQHYHLLKCMFYKGLFTQRQWIEKTKRQKEKFKQYHLNCASKWFGADYIICIS